MDTSTAGLRPATYGFGIAGADDVRRGFPVHFHEEYAVAVTARASHRLRVDGRTRDVPAGAIVALNPLQLHSAEPSPRRGWSYRMLYLPASVMLAAAVPRRCGGALPMFRRAVVVDSGVARQLLALFVLREAGRDGLSLDSQTLLVLGELTRRHCDGAAPVAPGHREHSACRIVREYLHAHLASPVRLSTLSELVGLNPQYLVRVFRAATGIPPHAYLTRIRIARAQRLLAAGEQPATVAAQTGFSDQSHLTSHFKRLLGVTPGRYARLNAR